MDLFATAELIHGGLEILIGALIAGAIGAVVSYLLAPDLKNNSKRGSSVNVRSAEEPQSVVYGFTTKGGVLFYINGTGDDNKYLHEMLDLASHECEAIGSIYFNAVTVDEELEIEIPPPPEYVSHLGLNLDIYYNSERYHRLINAAREEARREKGFAFGEKSRFVRHLGGVGQVADPLAVAENDNWTAAHKAEGRCYLYARLEYDREVFTSFIPNITAEVFGKKDIYDPRDEQERWTMNPALIVADILETYLDVERANIDQDSLIRAAVICDEIILKKDSSEEIRYTANGSFQLDGSWEDYLTPFINAMAGSVVEWGGTYYIHAGSWTPEVLTITDDDFMGAVSRQASESDQKRANSCKGKYRSPSNYDKDTEFPPVKDAISIGEDGGLVNWLDITLEMVNTHTQAQRLASIFLNETRSDETISVEVPLVIGLDVKPWDNVRLDSEMFGINATYRVIEHRIVPATGRNGTVSVELVLKSHSSSIYDWTPATQEKDTQSAKTNLPGVGSKSPTGITYSLNPIFSHADHKPADLTVNWTDPSDGFEAIEIEFTMSVECRLQDDGTAVSPDPPVAGPWEEVTISEAREILPAIQTANIEILDESKTAGPYDFQNHTIIAARIRTRINSQSYGPWLVPDVE